MKELLEMIVKVLVDRPEAVEINETVGAYAHILELKVAKEDLGKVIGKRGAHAAAIRTILAAASGKDDKRYILEILEDRPAGPSHRCISRCKPAKPRGFRPSHSACT